jgi:hypothetical protein
MESPGKIITHTRFGFYISLLTVITTILDSAIIFQNKPE